jgi:hypothetical protein
MVNTISAKKRGRLFESNTRDRVGMNLVVLKNAGTSFVNDDPETIVMNVIAQHDRSAATLYDDSYIKHLINLIFLKMASFTANR